MWAWRPKFQNLGAGEGNRTLVISLEGCCSTIELHPHRDTSLALRRLRRKVVGEVGLEPTKLKAADLQSAPFATRDTPPIFNNENRGLNPATGWRYGFPPVCVRTSEKIPPNKGVAADR